MSDVLINQFVARGTAAARAAFTPNPATPPAGPSHGYVWHETDTGLTYAWDGSAWDQVGATPGVHGSSHASGGGDPINLATGFTAVAPQFARLGLGGAVDDTSPLKVYGQIEIPPQKHGNSGASLTLNWNTSPRHTFTLTADCDLALVNPTDCGPYVVIMKTGAGTFVPIWPVSVRWVDDTPPNTEVPDAFFLVTLIYVADEGMYLGSFNGPYSFAS
jgi:hypothetical protein